MSTLLPDSATEYEQAVKVNDLKVQVTNAREVLYYLENKLKEEQHTLQTICHHEFVRESDNDYHNSRCYYVCQKCDYWSYYRPTQS